jgi:glucose-1-phosphate cytidylyltransferase
VHLKGRCPPQNDQYFIADVNELMEAIILCGGLGTRMREETEFKPKPMVAIGGRPILWHIMRHFRIFGVRDFILCLGYKGDLIRDYFLNYRNYNGDIELDLATGEVNVLREDKVDWRVRLVDTGSETLTGARMRMASHHLRGTRCFATYGDGVSTVDLNQLLAFHRENGKAATVTAVRPPSRFGELLLEGSVVKSFMEKPQTGAGWINGGFMVFETASLRELPDRKDLSLEGEVLEELAAREQLSVFTHEGFWQCMDTFREMQLLNDLWANGTAPWKIW